MGKKLVLAVAFSIVLGSGAFFNAQADCGCFSWFHWSSICDNCSPTKDRDLAALDKNANNDWERDMVNANYIY